MNPIYGFQESECFHCKRKYVRNPEWAYKTMLGSNEKYFCSWKCMREFERKLEEDKKREREERKKAKSERPSVGGKGTRKNGNRGNAGNGHKPKDNA